MKPLTNAELATFCNQLALILRSGISAPEGLSIMIEDTPEGEGKTLLETLLSHLEATGSLSEALSESGCFPPYMCSMIQLGEQSGRLDDVTQSLAAYYQREDSLSKSIKSAVTYPLVMLGMMIVVLLVLIIKVLPVFNQVFQQLGASLTGVSGAILTLGDSLSQYGILFIVLIIIAAALFFYFFGTAKGRKHTGGLANTFFVTRNLAAKIACARFASGMYLSLSSGLDTDQSLEMVSQLVEHPATRQKINTLRELTAQGLSFAEAILQTKLFSGIYARMISIGAKTGAMDEVLQQISVQYDEEIEDRMASAISKLEPTLVAILSVAVGLILLSVMLPLMGIMSNIG
ncbi:MAG: type II secretion system F family protein [Lachnospiraceae bacterium]|jgi:type IV pilus assembly protein PilC|nr:type II secretion system F family protein [Lachnospiraceae bacterium]